MFGESVKLSLRNELMNLGVKTMAKFLVEKTYTSRYVIEVEANAWNEASEKGLTTEIPDAKKPDEMQMTDYAVHLKK